MKNKIAFSNKKDEGRGRRTNRSTIGASGSYGFSSKGQSPMISHTFVVGFSLFLVFIVVMTLNYLEEDYRNLVGKNEVSQLCGIIKYSADKIYNPTDYVSPTNSTMGKIVLSLPEKAAGVIYSATFVNSAVYVTTKADPIINATCNIDINATFSGSTIGGETEITWTSYPDKKDEIVMKAIGK